MMYAVIVDSLSCVYSVDGDMRYMVYRWDFHVWIIPSRYQSYESIYWARTTGFAASVHLFTWCLIHVRMYMLTTQFSTHSFLIWIYRYTCACPCMSLGTHHTSWGVFDSSGTACLDLLDHEGLPVDQSGAAVASWINGRPVRGPFLPCPLLGSRVFLFITCEYLLYYLYLFISLYSRICTYRSCNILVILYHILW